MVTNDNHEWRTTLLYTIAECSHLAHVSNQTVRNWLYGYHSKNFEAPPILGSQEKKPLVSFLDFIEILVAASFRKNRVGLNVSVMLTTFRRRNGVLNIHLLL